MALEITCLMSALNYTTSILATEYNEVCTVLFIDSDCGMFTTGTLKFNVKMNGSTDSISVRIIDDSDQTVLGSLTGINSDGMKSFSFTIPSSDTVMIVQSKKDSDSSGDPDIKAGYIYYQPE